MTQTGLPVKNTVCKELKGQTSVSKSPNTFEIHAVYASQLMEPLSLIKTRVKEVLISP